jgi:excisionase family DNA binding protein
MFDKRDSGAVPRPSPVRAGLNTPSDKFLTIQEVGERLNLCRTTIWRLMNQHGLRFVRIGGTRRIRERDLETWLERHSVSLNTNDNGNAGD